MIIPDSYISSINGICLVLLFVFVILGLISGAVKQIFNLLSNVIGIVIAFMFSNLLSSLFPIIKAEFLSLNFGPLNNFILLKINNVVWFVILFFSVKLVLLLLKPVFVALFKLPLLKQLDKVLGVVVSLISYCLFCVMICYFISLPIFTNGKEIMNKTYLKPINEITQKIINKANKKIINSIDLKDIDLEKMEIDEETFNSIIESLNLSKDDVSKFFDKVGLTLEDISNFMKNNKISLKEALSLFDLDDIKQLFK